MAYTVRQGESISDATLNQFGDIAAWENLLTANFFDSWTPNLYSGQVLLIPDNAPNNPGNIVDLALYPANNFSVPDITEQINAIFALMENLTPIPSENILPVLDTNVYYIVRVTETVGDSILNGSGDISNWDIISQGNFWDSWTPPLYAGEKVAIPSTVNMNLNNFRALNQYPANNHSVPDIYNQIYAIFGLMNGNRGLWILRTGFWDGSGVWTKDGIWIA